MYFFYYKQKVLQYLYEIDMGCGKKNVEMNEIERRIGQLQESGKEKLM